MKLVVSRVNLVRKDGLVIYDPADLIDEGGSRRDLLAGASRSLEYCGQPQSASRAVQPSSSAVPA